MMNDFDAIGDGHEYPKSYYYASFFREKLLKKHPGLSKIVSPRERRQRELLLPIHSNNGENEIDLEFDLDNEQKSFQEITIHYPSIDHSHQVMETTIEELLDRVLQKVTMRVLEEEVTVEFFELVKRVKAQEPLARENTVEEIISSVSGETPGNYSYLVTPQELFILKWKGGTHVPSSETNLENLVKLRNNFNKDLV